ncbi:hypothetical protein C9374_005258 [Naegleria lovaniensis]|uniref:Uncharacterized protein n=1 Tax=Naegleria lovaniensis TaxID=51637 RepID=A0AA88GR81_NAELO|nr:uncharacterized protein C9374_005258 [Naegleria lovaniensis]KAG2382678.1 hypothetical protein C9374_005258 [Naegleria lovaniensis]
MGNISSQNPIFVSDRDDEPKPPTTPSYHPSGSLSPSTQSRSRRPHREELTPEMVVLQKIESSKILSAKLQNLNDRDRLVRQLSNETELKNNFLNLDFVLQYLEKENLRKQQDDFSNIAAIRQRYARRQPNSLGIPGIVVTSVPRDSEASESTGDAVDHIEDDDSEIPPNIPERTENPSLATRATNLYRAMRRSIGRSIGSEASSSHDILPNIYGPSILDPVFSTLNHSCDDGYNEEIPEEEIQEHNLLDEITFKVKLILVDTLKTDASKNVRQIISPILAKMDKLPNHGIFHSSISIGPWILEFTDCGLCIPRKITSKMALLSIDIGEVKGWTAITEAVNRIAQVVCRWNTQVSYSRNNVRKESIIFSSPSSQLAVEGQRRISDAFYGSSLPSTPEHSTPSSLSPPLGGSVTLTGVAQNFVGSASSNSSALSARHSDRSSCSYQPNKQEQKTVGNCQDFVDEVLEALEITPVFSESMHQFLLNLRNRGDSNLTIKLDDQFLDKFGLKNNSFNNIKEMLGSNKKTEKTSSYHGTPPITNDNSRKRSKSDTPKFSNPDPLSTIEIQNHCISFHTHEQLDLFVNLLLQKDPQFPRTNPQTYDLLKAFDRAFWIKYKSAILSKPNNLANNKVLQQETQLEMLTTAPLNMQSKAVELANNIMIWNGYGEQQRRKPNHQCMGCPFGDPFCTMSFIHIE